MGHENNGNGHSPAPEPAEMPVLPVPVAAAAVGDDSADLAALVGLEVEPKADATPATNDLLDGEDLEEADDDGGKSDKSGKTKTPLWANPFLKVLFVAGFAGSAFLVVALVFGALQTTGQGDSAPEIVRSEEAAEEEEDPIDAALRRQQEEIGQLKTQNALGNQQQAMALQAQRTVDPTEVLALRNRQLDLVETIQENQEESAAVTAPKPPSSPPVSSRPTTSTSRPSPAPSVRPSPVSSRPAPALPAPPPPPTVALPPIPEPIDPQAQWETLVALGSYGQGTAVADIPLAPVATTSEPSASVTVAPVPEMPAAELPSFSAPTAQVASDSEPDVLEFSEPTVDESLLYAQEEAAILGYTLKTVPSGTFAAARLVTPIYWAQDLANEQQPQRTALELTEPLLADDGTVALPAGTALVAEVNVVAGSGLLELQVTDVVMSQDGVQRTMQLPNQNMVIAGNDGNPLIAREIQDDGEIRAAELQLAALGALGNLGELLNRPESSTTIVGGDTSISTVENGPVNILAGLAEGAIDAVLPLEQARTIDRIGDISDRPRIWFHGADGEVSVFVIDEFTFQLD